MYISWKKSVHDNMIVRAWNILFLASLMGPREHLQDLLFAELPNFLRAYQSTLRFDSRPGSGYPETWSTDINHGYIAIKLWIMLAHITASNRESDVAYFIVWNELWPPFERLLHFLENESGLPLVSPARIVLH